MENYCYFLVNVTDPHNFLFSSVFQYQYQSDNSINLQMLRDVDWSFELEKHKNLRYHHLYKYTHHKPQNAIRLKSEIISNFKQISDRFEYIAEFVIDPQSPKFASYLTKYKEMIESPPTDKLTNHCQMIEFDFTSSIGSQVKLTYEAHIGICDGKVMQMICCPSVTLFGGNPSTNLNLY